MSPVTSRQKMSKENEIFNYLHKIGCCKHCCLRYICVRNPENFSKSDSYIKQKKLIEDSIENDEKILKKIKSNPCIICLGLLQDIFMDDIVEKVSQDETVKSYDSNVFTCSISFPACIYIREHSVRVDLEEKFPDFFTADILETQLNKVWKWIIRDRLESKIDRKFEQSDTCDFSINILLSYEFDSDELDVLPKMQPVLFNTRQIQRKKYPEGLYSRKSVLEALEITKPEDFKNNSPVPPEVSDKFLTLKEISCYHNSVYLAGRYCKYSRELSQTPWVIDGVKTMETSVQEIIFEPIQKFLGVSEDSLKFSSSGREDVDVRCLGIGRPFVVEYMNPKKTNFTFDELRTIETEINANPTIEIRDLQLVTKDELRIIKEGEESKTKEYEAVCICDKTVSDEMLNIINVKKTIELEQETPIRVLHRRPLAIRRRTIHSMHAEKIPGRDNLFKLKVITQAGTYVKEFVHGDFNRTKPNIRSIVGCEVDILALDVTKINLDWPNPIEYNK